MGATWKISFTAYEIPREKFEDVKKIIADVLTPNYDFYLADDKNFGEIEIFNYEICSSFDFEDFAIVLNDSIEVLVHDYSIISDGFIDIIFYISSFCLTSTIIKNLR